MTTATPPATASNTELISWVFDVLNARDLRALRPLWTDETFERFPDQTVRGPDAIAGYLEALFAGLPDSRMKVISIVGEGDDVFVHWQLSGTFSGARFQGIEPTGQPVVLDGLDHFVVHDGKIVSNFVVFDQMQFARQIGMLPPDDSRADRALKAAFNAKTRLLGRLKRSS